VRQVVCQCVERGAVMDGVNRGMLGLIDLAFDAFMKAAETADHLHEKNLILQGIRSTTKTADQIKIEHLNQEILLLSGELEREKGKTMGINQKLEFIEKQRSEKAKRGFSGYARTECSLNVR
jgi:hypothetical protein